MRIPRLLLLGAAAVAALSLLAVGVACSGSFQTWAVQRFLAARPERGVTVGAVSVGWNRSEARDVRLALPGGVLTVPRLETGLSLYSVIWERKAKLFQLSSKDWTLDLSRQPVAPPAGDREQKVAATVVRAFGGVLASLALPFDLTVESVALEGDVILPASAGRGRLIVTGGGLAAGREGRFELAAQAQLADEAVRTVELHGELKALADGSGRTVQLGAKLAAKASGRRFPLGLAFAVDLGAKQEENGESYTVGMVSEGRQVVALSAQFHPGGQRFSGGWKLDVQHEDVVPFALGRALPEFAAKGRGAFETDAGFRSIRVTGHLGGEASRLEVGAPKLVDWGRLEVEADFDLAEQDGNIGVRRCEAMVRGVQPIAELRALQVFEFSPGTGEVRSFDPKRELFGVVLRGLPLAWLRPLWSGYGVSGGDLRGELMGTPRGGGLGVRSVGPLTAGSVNLSYRGTALLSGVDVGFEASADYSPQGWQAGISGLNLSRAGGRLLELEAKTGQIAGSNEAVKAAGRFSIGIPQLLAQPVAAGTLALSGGVAAGGFVASFNHGTELQVDVALRELAVMEAGKSRTLPEMTAKVRADFGPGPRLAFDLPVLIAHEGRTTDVRLAGSVEAEGGRRRKVELQAAGAHIEADDLGLLALMFPSASSRTDPRGTTSPWSDWQGSLSLHFKEWTRSGRLGAADIAAEIRLGADGTVKLESGQANLADYGRAAMAGTLTFDPTASRPYALAADLVLKDVDVGSLLRTRGPGRVPTVEGRFEVTGKLQARMAGWAALEPAISGDFQLSSKGGIFRGLPVNVAGGTEPPGRLAGLFASAGSMLGGLTGRKEPANIVSRSEAVAEFSRGLHAISYDQLSVTVVRDAAFNTILRDFTLISPELRLTGNGTALHKPGRSWVDDGLAMEFRLRARGRQGDLLSYLGVLENRPDDLGYRNSTLPLVVTGTVEKPDATELNARLAALANEKGGLAEKAAEFLNKLRGGSK